MRAAWTTGVLVAAIAGAVSAAHAQSDAAPPPPSSVERVQRGLERKSAVDLLTIRRGPTFSVTVTEALPYENPFGVEKAAASRWTDSVASTIGAGVAPIVALSAVAASLAGDGSMDAKPLLLMDALAAGTLVAGKVARSLHARRVRKTRERIRLELEEFCAAHGCIAPPPP